MLCGAAACTRPPRPMAARPPVAYPTEPAASDPTAATPSPSDPPPTAAQAAPPSPAPVPSESDDQRLIASVRRAVAKRPAPESLASEVGQKPLVNTLNGPSLAVLRRVILIRDDAHADEPLDLASATAVMYWRRPVDGDNPHFVGIQVRKDGTQAVFFAIILPP